MPRRERGRFIQKKEVGESPWLHEVIRVFQRRGDAVDPVLMFVLFIYLTISVNPTAITALREDTLSKGNESFGVDKCDLHDYQSCFRIRGSVKIA